MLRILKLSDSVIYLELLQVLKRFEKRILIQEVCRKKLIGPRNHAYLAPETEWVKFGEWMEYLAGTRFNNASFDH